MAKIAQKNCDFVFILMLLLSVFLSSHCDKTGLYVIAFSYLLSHCD